MYAFGSFGGISSISLDSFLSVKQHSVEFSFSIFVFLVLNKLSSTELMSAILKPLFREKKQGTLQHSLSITSHGRLESWEKPISFFSLVKKLYQLSDWSYDNFH